MGFSSILITFIFAFIGAAFVNGTVDDMGPCKKICNHLTKFDIDEYAISKGDWKYQLVPKLPFFDDIKYAGVRYKSTGTKGVYDSTIYNILKNGTRQTFSDGRVTYLGAGRSINNATVGGDCTTDYRNVLVKKKLSKEKVAALIKLDRSFEFENELRELDVQGDEEE